MNYNEEHFKLLEQSFTELKELILVKGKEYVRNQDPLWNFYVGARKQNKHPAEILQGFALKHDISVDDLIQDLKQGRVVSMLQVKEKIHDRIVYNLLLLSIFNKECIEL